MLSEASACTTCMGSGAIRGRHLWLFVIDSVDQAIMGAAVRASRLAGLFNGQKYTWVSIPQALLRGWARQGQIRAPDIAGLCSTGGCQIGILRIG